MFVTHTLADATALIVLARQTPHIDTDGTDFCAFRFSDLDEEAARNILRTPDAETMRKFHREWRVLRRKMQAATEAARVGQ